MLDDLEADLQFLRLGIEQEKTFVSVIRFSELHGTLSLKRWKRSGVIMPMHSPSGLYMQAALASYSFGREALCVAFISGDLFCAILFFRQTRSTVLIQTS